MQGMLISDEEWGKLLKDADEFDMDAYQERRARATQDPEYIKWFESRPQKVKDAFQAMPFERFYTDKATQTAVYRLYGVTENKDGTCGYHACSAHLFWTNDVIGGISAEDLLPVEKWNEEQLQKIRMNNVPQAFLFPDGWIKFAYQQ